MIFEAERLSRVFQRLRYGVSDRDTYVRADTAYFSPQSLFAIPAVRIWRTEGNSGLQFRELFALF